MDPRTIDLENCIRLIEEHVKKEKEKFIKDFPNEGIQVLNGRFGAYIKKGKENYKIPKGTDPQSLELEEILSIIEKSGTKKSKR